MRSSRVIPSRISAACIFRRFLAVGSKTQKSRSEPPSTKLTANAGLPTLTPLSASWMNAATAQVRDAAEPVVDSFVTEEYPQPMAAEPRKRQRRYSTRSTLVLRSHAAAAPGGRQPGGRV